MTSVTQTIETARALVAPAKGLLAADESTRTITRRFESASIASMEETRRDYREMLFRTQGIGQFLSGVILYDETLRQKAGDGTPLVKVLQDQGIVPGIKVDRSTTALPFAPGEVVTEGLDGLRERLREYRDIGARFTKWRAVINIGQGIPSRYCIEANAEALARYAALSQEEALTPIVEPEVLMDGDHTIDRCFEVTEATLREVFYRLALHRVAFEGMLLKPNMVLSGKSAPTRAGPVEVAEKTVACLMRTVPAAVPGIVFLSGGQTDEEATANLNAIVRRGAEVRAPWELSFSYARGLQSTPMKVWAGKAENVPQAQAAFYQRAKLTSAARQGAYSPDMEKEAAAD